MKTKFQCLNCVFANQIEGSKYFCQYDKKQVFDGVKICAAQEMKYRIKKPKQ